MWINRSQWSEKKCWQFDNFVAVLYLAFAYVQVYCVVDDQCLASDAARYVSGYIDRQRSQHILYRPFSRLAPQFDMWFWAPLTPACQVSCLSSLYMNTFLRKNVQLGMQECDRPTYIVPQIICREEQIYSPKYDGTLSVILCIYRLNDQFEQFTHINIIQTISRCSFDGPTNAFSMWRTL